MTAILERRRVYGIYKDALGNGKGNQKISIEILHDVFADGLSIPQDVFEIHTSNQADHVGEYEALLYTRVGSFLNYKIKFPTKDKQPLRFSLAPGADVPLDELINLESAPEQLPFSLELLSALYAAVAGCVLTGISFASSAAVTATDTIKAAIGKLQKQSSNLAVAVAENTADITELENEIDDIYEEIDLIEIPDGVSLGETSLTAYRGDRGKIAYDHSQAVTGNPHNVTKAQIGLPNVDNTSDASKPVSVAQAAADVAARDAAITTIRNGVAAAGDDLNKIWTLLSSLNSAVTGTTPDGDSIVNTLQEVFTMLNNFPEATNLLNVLIGKVNTADVVNALNVVASGKVLDARQGKILNDAISELNNFVNNSLSSINNIGDIYDEGNGTKIVVDDENQDILITASNDVNASIHINGANEELFIQSQLIELNSRVTNFNGVDIEAATVGKAASGYFEFFGNPAEGDYLTINEQNFNFGESENLGLGQTIAETINIAVGVLRSVFDGVLEFESGETKIYVKALQRGVARNGFIIHADSNVISTPNGELLAGGIDGLLQTKFGVDSELAEASAISDTDKLAVIQSDVIVEGLEIFTYRGLYENKPFYIPQDFANTNPSDAVGASISFQYGSWLILDFDGGTFAVSDGSFDTVLEVQGSWLDYNGDAKSVSLTERKTLKSVTKDVLADSLGVIRKLSTTTVRTNVGTKQDLFVVPVGKKCAITTFIIRVGENDAEALEGELYPNFATGAYINISDDYYGNSYKLLNNSISTFLTSGGETVSCVFNSLSINATLDIDVFGYLIDA